MKDLVKFLQDVGPLEKKLEKTLTSKRLHGMEEAGGVDTQHKNDRTRRRRHFPLIGSHLEGGDDDNDNEYDGIKELQDEEGDITTTARTTDFSHNASLNDEAKFKWNDLELIQLLQHDWNDDDFATKAVDQHMLDRKIEGKTEEERQEEIELVKQALKYTTSPHLMLDDENTFIGALPDNIEMLKRFKLRSLDPNEGIRMFIESGSSSTK